MVIIYFDVSCLNRPYDDQRQYRIKMETEAIAEIIGEVEAGSWMDVSSEMAAREIEAIQDEERRERVRILLPDDRDIIALSEEMLLRAREIRRLGFRPADAVHVAVAEAISADVLLTCDDQFCRTAKKHANLLRIAVENPVEWLEYQR